MCAVPSAPTDACFVEWTPPAVSRPGGPYVHASRDFSCQQRPVRLFTSDVRVSGAGHAKMYLGGAGAALYLPRMAHRGLPGMPARVPGQARV